MNEDKVCSWTYTGLTLLCMTILTFMSGFYRAIQFSDAEEIGSGGSGFIGTIYFRADSTALLIGHILFAINLGLVWFAMSKYIKKYKIVDYVIPVMLEIVIVCAGCLIQFIYMSMLGPEGIFSSVEEPMFANVSVGLWPLSTLAVFIVLFVKAHYKDISN